MNTLVTNLFLRIYAMNLRRPWRNHRGAAWSDAVYTMDILVVVPALSWIMAGWIFLGDHFPASFGAFGRPKSAELVVVLAVGVLVDLGSTRQYGRTSTHPYRVTAILPFLIFYG